MSNGIDQNAVNGQAELARTLSAEAGKTPKTDKLGAAFFNINALNPNEVLLWAKKALASHKELERELAETKNESQADHACMLAWRKEALDLRAQSVQSSAPATLGIEHLIAWLDARGMASKIVGVNETAFTLRQVLREYASSAVSAKRVISQEIIEIAERWAGIHTDESYGPQGKNLGILARAVLDAYTATPADSGNDSTDI